MLGQQIPAQWSLDFTVALTFIGIVFPALKDRAGVASALSAGVVAVLAVALPLKLGLIVAALTGIGVGMAVESLSPTRRIVEPQPRAASPEEEA